MPERPPRRTLYAKSLAYRTGSQMVSRRNPLKPSDLSDLELITIASGSAKAADTLHEHFGSVKGLATFGGQNGFAVLLGYPGVTPNVIAKLEAWLESVGRVVE